MLPTSEAWYRGLLVAAVLFGLAGAGIALAYSGVTEAGIDLFFGSVTEEPWSGEWWWIPLVAAGALLVATLRRLGSVPEHVPGTVAYARKAWVEPSSAATLVGISAVSLVFGASLGPSFGVTLAGGGLASWFVTRKGFDQPEARQEFTLTGMSGSFGSLFSAPVFGAILVGELSPTRKKSYVAAFIPELIAATIGYAIFFGVTGKVMLEIFEIDGYSYEALHLLYGALLGVLSVVTIVLYTTIGKVVQRLAALVPRPYVRAILGGGLVGLIAFALPLTATSGSGELAYETSQIPELGAGLLAVVLLAKMVAVGLSQQAGFLGGAVFPMLFIGGTAGILVNELFPDIPAPLAVAGMVAAVPGAVIAAPLSFTLLAVGTVGAGVTAVAPVAVAVIIAHLSVAALEFFRSARESV
jgi:H+/Cl- antiporter ClcA